MAPVRSRYMMLGGTKYVDGAGRAVRMAYSARSASVLMLGARTAARLAAGEAHLLDAAELDRLRGLGAVVEDTDDELAAVISNYTAGSASVRDRGFTIMPTSYCNMACDYCGQEHFKSAVNQDRTARVTARVTSTIADPSTEAVNVTWFGGEPLLALRVIREMSAAFTAAADAAGKGYTARMATNGSLLTARTLAELHFHCRLTRMDITIDGPQEMHDERRLKRNGIGSFHHTIAVLADAVRERTVPGLRIGIRVNVDARNEDSVTGLITDLACYGLTAPQVELHLMPVHSWGNDVSAVELEARRFARMEVGWLRYARSVGLGVPGMPAVLKKTTCRATSAQGEIIDSQGRVYSCSEHPLVPGVRDTGILATIDELAGSAARPRGMYDDWYEQAASAAQPCSRCPILPVCGGSCPKLWREGHMPCPSTRFNWEDRLDMAASRLGLRPAAAVLADSATGDLIIGPPAADSGCETRM